MVSAFGPFIFTKAEWGFSRDVRAEKAGAPVAFDVFDHTVGAVEMCFTRWAVGVEHGIGHVADESYILSERDHLADGEGTAQDAHVQVDATEYDIVDVVLRQDVPGFLAVIGDDILLGDLDESDLAGPGGTNFAFGSAIAAHVGIVDGENTFAFGIGPAPGSAPAFGSGEGFWRFCEGSTGCTLALGSVLVKVCAGAGGMDDKHALATASFDHVVHGAGEFDYSVGCGLTPVLIPHVADDDSGFLWVPCDSGFDGLDGGLTGSGGTGAEVERH